MTERHVDFRSYQEHPLVKRVTTEEMVERGVVFSRSFLSEYLKERVKIVGRNYQLRIEEFGLNFEEFNPDLVEEMINILVLPFSGELHVITGWQSELGLDETGCLEPDLVPSHKISRYEEAASYFSNRETVLLTGKLEGTMQHFEAIRYLTLYAGLILALEPRLYYQECAKQDERLREEPYFRRNLLASLYAHHPLISRVVFVPEATHKTPEAANLFYEAFFNSVGPTYACATEGDPYLEKKLLRGKQPEQGEDDWRVIPLFEGAQTSSRLARFNLFDYAIVEARLEALKAALALSAFSNL